MHLVDSSPTAAAYGAAIRNAHNELGDLSLEVGSLAGLLKLISHSGQLEEQQQMAVGVLADMAQRFENEIEAIRTRLDEATDAA